jgi:hypothetical protein
VRRFELQRDIDETGISGTGRIAEGVEFSSGECALKWSTAVWSVVFYLNVAAVEHIHGHQGKTRLVWLDD